MRNNRLTILLTEEERATVDDLALRAGVSSSEFMRELVEEFENLTPEDEAELDELFAQLNAALPGLHESLTRLETRMQDTQIALETLRDQVETTNNRIANIETAIESGALRFENGNEN